MTVFLIVATAAVYAGVGKFILNQVTAHIK